MNQNHFKVWAAILLLAPLFSACGGGGASGGNPPPTNPDWVLNVDITKSGAPINPALLGHYDLSGALYHYDDVTGLMDAMQAIGFPEWRIGVGRWEIGSQLLPALTDGTICPQDPMLTVPAGTSDTDLINARSWFTDTGSTVTLADTMEDSRYNLAYVRDTIDTAMAFGAAPYVSIDTMPLALAANRTAHRTDCADTFMNAVTNNAPADNLVFSQAVKGLVQRVVEGSGGEPGRKVSHWEIWNEPELPSFWQPGFPAGTSAFFDMATTALIALNDYRATSTNPDAQALKFGLGSFANAATAAAVIEAYDAAATPIPLDFISFHAYHNDPLDIRADIAMVADAAAASSRYQNLELVLAEWGSDLATTVSNPAYANSMSPPLLMSSVIAMGAALGLDRSHHALFYDYHSAVTLGLVDNSGNPKPLYRAYELLHQMIGDGNVMLVPDNAPGNQSGDWGNVLVTKDSAGIVRALFINRDNADHIARVDNHGAALTSIEISTFSDSSQPLQRQNTTTTDIEVPAHSMVMAAFL